MEGSFTDTLKKVGTQGLYAIAVVAISSGITYYVCNDAFNDERDDLKEQIAALEETAEEAQVTQRISEQMEDIAFQQKMISDKQREEAENQKKIADIERGKAEMERGLAQQAEQKAIASAKEAEQMRLLADQQREEAIRNMKAAELARAQTDSLYYLSLGTTLAQSSLSFGTNVSNLSRLLAYSSWYYTTQYGGNVYDDNLFKALLYSSNNIERISGIIKGSVRAIDMAEIEGQRWAMGITDYGEMFCYNEQGKHLVFANNTYIYRDMTIIDGKYCAAITAEGTVSLIDYSKTVSSAPYEEKSVKLPKGQWRKIITVKEHNALLCLSDKQAVWIDDKELTAIANQPLEGSPEVMGLEGSTIHIFGTNGAHYCSDSPGEIVAMPLLTVKKRITAYHYVESKQLHIIGTEDGTIYITNKGKTVSTLTGHDGAITYLGDTGKYLVSTSYDNQLRYWDMTDTSAILSNMSVTLSKWPITFVIDQQNNNIWLGLADGTVNRYGINPNINAQYTQDLITHDFTKVEWDRYIGPHIPFRSFIKPKDGTEKGGRK